MKKEEINLEKPIFVCYINVSGISRQCADEKIYKIVKDFNYKNITTWIVPRLEGETKIELIWDPREKLNKNTDDSMKDLVKEISDVLNSINTTKDPVIGLKKFLRSWKLNRLL